MMEYIDNGNSLNSVNCPTVDIGVCKIASRVAVMQLNVPNMIGQATVTMAANGINISDMTNKSKGKFAYTLMDLDKRPDDQVIQKLASVEGILRVRVIQ